MTQYILKGKPDVSGLLRISAGKIFYNKFIQFDKNRVCMIDAETDETLTYGECLRQSIKLADALKGLGLKQNDVISQVSENSIKYFTPYLSSLYYGFAFNAINPAHTKYELCEYLGQTKPKCVFCSRKILSKMLEVQSDCPFIKIIVVTNAPAGEGYYSMNQLIDEQVENLDFAPLDFDPNEQLALILLSSGTTGRPKAVALNHKNVRLSIMQSGPEYVGTTDTDVQLFFLPFFHVISTAVLGFMYYGAKTVILKGFEPSMFLATIEKYKCTFSYFVPLIVNFISECPLVDKYDLSSLKRIVCGSAPVSEDKIKIFLKRIPNTILCNLYGLTECSCIVTISPLDRNNLENVGTVLSNCEAKYIDLETGENLGANSIGELCLRGDCVFKAYYNNEEATKEALDHEGFFKTGDVGYFDDLQRLHIIDRIKDMIKYKGYQVSPVELETVLRLHDFVQDAAVIGIPDKRAGEVPIAFVVRKGELSEKELLDFLADHLSEYKYLHGGIRFIKEVPRNTMNKIDRKGLKEMWRDMEANSANVLKAL